MQCVVIQEPFSQYLEIYVYEKHQNLGKVVREKCIILSVIKTLRAEKCLGSGYLALASFY